MKRNRTIFVLLLVAIGILFLVHQCTSDNRQQDSQIIPSSTPTVTEEVVTEEIVTEEVVTEEVVTEEVATEEIVTEEIVTEEVVTKSVEDTLTVEDVVQKFASVDDKVYFAYNAFDLSDETKRILDTQVAFISEHEGLIVVIEGHTDEQGTRDYNFALAQKRANAVREYLKNGDEGDNTQYKIISYGEERPAVLGRNAEAWAKNRRATTKIVQYQ